jgi:Integrase core domain
MVESFWARMQVELLNRRAWKTRIELATAIYDHIELFHNTRRRHSSLAMLTPTEYEHLHTTTNAARLQNPHPIFPGQITGFLESSGIRRIRFAP